MVKIDNIVQAVFIILLQYVDERRDGYCRLSEISRASRSFGHVTMLTSITATSGHRANLIIIAFLIPYTFKEIEI